MFDYNTSPAMSSTRLCIGLICSIMPLFFACSSIKKDKEPIKYSDLLEKVKDTVVGGFQTDKTKNLVYHINHLPHTTVFAKCIRQSGLEAELSGEGPFTVVIPDDSAFAKMPAGAIDNLLKPAMHPSLKNILTYHIVLQPISYSEFKSGNAIQTMEGKNLLVTEVDGKIHINKNPVKIKDIYTSNGIIHIIDRVMIPQKSPKSKP